MNWIMIISLILAIASIASVLFILARWDIDRHRKREIPKPKSRTVADEIVRTRELLGKSQHKEQHIAIISCAAMSSEDFLNNVTHEVTRYCPEPVLVSRDNIIYKPMLVKMNYPYISTFLVTRESYEHLGDSTNGIVELQMIMLERRIHPETYKKYSKKIPNMADIRKRMIEDLEKL